MRMRGLLVCKLGDLPQLLLFHSGRNLLGNKDTSVVGAHVSVRLDHETRKADIERPSTNVTFLVGFDGCGVLIKIGDREADACPEQIGHAMQHQTHFHWKKRTREEPCRMRR